MKDNYKNCISSFQFSDKYINVCKSLDSDSTLKLRQGIIEYSLCHLLDMHSLPMKQSYNMVHNLKSSSSLNT